MRQLASRSLWCTPSSQEDVLYVSQLLVTLEKAPLLNSTFPNQCVFRGVVCEKPWWYLMQRDPCLRWDL